MGRLIKSELKCNDCGTKIVKHGARKLIGDTAKKMGWKFVSQDFKDKKTDVMTYERYWLCDRCR